MASKYSKFRGKSGEDPDAHTRKFEKTYGINNAPPVVPLHKESTFESTLSGKASKWLAEFPEDHFLTYDAVKTAFLIEKTVSQNLEKLWILKQKKRNAEEYAARFRVLLQRVPVAQQPAQEVLNNYFMKGLIKDLRTALAMVDKVNTPLPDVIAMAVLAGESLEDDEDDDDDAKRSSKKKHSHKGKEKHKEKHSAGSDSESNSTRSSSEGDSGSSSEGEREKATKKSHRSGKGAASSSGTTPLKSSKDAKFLIINLS